MKRLMSVSLLTLLLCACGTSLPPEAQTTASAVATSLASHDHAAITKLVVSGQREGALGLAETFPVETDEKKADLTLSDILDLKFFTDIKSVEVSEDGASVEDESHAMVMMTIDYGESTFTVRHIKLIKEGDTWLIDFKATLDMWYRQDGASALSVLKMK